MEKSLIRFATAILDFSIRKGGAERYLIDLCNRMVKDGYEVHVYSERWDEEFPGIVLHKVKTIPFPKSIRLLSFAYKATKEMEKGRYDITLGVGNTLKADILQPHGGVHWAWFLRSLRAYENPVLWFMKFLGRLLSPKQWIQNYIEKAPFKRKAFKKVIAISEMVKEDLIRWYKISEDRIAVIYNGVDIKRFHPSNRQHREEIRKRHGIGGEFVILFVSNNFRMKGLGFLIKAFAKIKFIYNSELKLLILGRDNPKPYLRLAKRLGVNGDLIFAGSTDEPEKYYGAADILVHPTFYDACSLTVIEALASGLPVITTSFNGASGIIKGVKASKVVHNPKDVDGLAENIRYFLNQEVLKKASEFSRQIAEKYSEERNWFEVKQLFQNLHRESYEK